MISREKIEAWLNRKGVEKYTQYKNEVKGHVLKIEKMYDYYICDYCRMPIKILSDLKDSEQEGGKVFLPVSLLNNKKTEIAAHNRCIKSLVKELEELRKR